MTTNTNLNGGATMSNTVYQQQRDLIMIRRDLSLEKRTAMLAKINEAEVMGTGELVISNKRQLRPHLDTVMAEMGYITAININLTENGPVTTAKALGLGRYTREALTLRCGIVPVSNGEITLKEDYYAPFSKTFITVTFSDKCELDNIDNGVYILHDGGSTRVFIPRIIVGGGIRFFENNGEEFTEKEVKSIEGIRLYKILSFTASGVRRDGTSLFVDVTKKDIREEMHEDKSLGAYKIEKEAIAKAKKTLTPEKLTTKVVKDTQRFGQLQTADVDLGPINKWARLKGNFGRDKKFHDGMSFTLADFFAACISNVLTRVYGYKVTVLADAVVGMIVQTRPGMVKASSIIVDKDMMSELVIAYGGEKNIEMYGGNINIDVPEFFTDDNGIKLDWEFKTKTLNYHLLRIGEASQAYTSLQMLTKPLYGAAISRRRDEFGNVMTKLMNRQIDEDFENAITAKALMTPEEFENGFEHDAMLYLNSDEFMTNSAVRASKEQAFFRSQATKCSKLKCKVDGANLVLTDDIAEIFGKKVINYGEVYMPYYNNEIRKATKEYNATGKWSNPNVKFDNGYFYIEVFMIKYPSVGLAETYVARALSIYEIAKRCIKQFKVKGGSVERYYRSMDIANVVVPASEELMKQLAGMDFDFDTATVVSESGLVDLTKSIPVEIVNIES